MRKDLIFAIKKLWYGYPSACVPKSALYQILDADQSYGVVCRKSGKRSEIKSCSSLEEVKHLTDDGYRIFAILSREELEEVTTKLCKE